MKAFAAGLILILFFGIAVPSGAKADDQVIVTTDGVISYSNHPLDDRYRLLIAERRALQGSSTRIRVNMNIKYDRETLERIVASSAIQYGIDPGLLLAIAEVESNFNPQAISRFGARGLMQLMPYTARRFGVHDINDPQQNAEGAARYMRYLLNTFDGDFILSIAAYNAGDNAVRHYMDIPPISETQKFVVDVMSIWDSYGRTQ